MQQHITRSAYINENMQYKGRKITIVVETKRYNIPFVYVERERERERDRDREREIFCNARLVL